jgi:hypothetical protein
MARISDEIFFEMGVIFLVNLETTDIFRGAFLLASGGELAEVRVRNNGRRIATFLIAGENLAKLDQDYRTGRALVNPLQLRESLNHLRDVMFEKLRDYEGRTRHGDRKRSNRDHQT